MSNNLDLTRYIQLLKKRENERLSHEEYCEFVSHGAAVQNQISYNRKDDYLSLIKEYLDERMDSKIFISEFLELQDEDCKAEEILSKNFKQLSTFSIDSKLDEFSSLIEQISNECTLAFDYYPKDSYRIKEDEFRDYIKSMFFQIKNCLDK